MPEIEIYKPEDAIFVSKSSGTNVHYFLFDEYEIHQNTIFPHTTQQWHRHVVVEEVLVVTRGQITVLWLENGRTREQTLRENDILRVKQSAHTLQNKTDSDAMFVVFRMIPDGVPKQNRIKEDKILLEIPIQNYSDNKDKTL